MHALRTAVIEHTTAGGLHHDWLIEDPALPDPAAPHARLWTARVLPPPGHWPALRCFDLVPLPPHRRAYLTYQGEVSADRGRVKRVDEGSCHALLWTGTRLVLDVNMQAIRSRIELRRVSDVLWHAWLPAPAIRTSKHAV